MDPQRLAKWNQELAKCIRCGTCRQFCPIHQVLDDERYTARGKLYLVDQWLNEDFLLTDGFMELIGTCVMCKGCTANCPSGVNTYQIFLEMRQEIVREKGLSLTKKSIFHALSWQRFFDFGLTTGAWFQRLIFKKAKNGPGQIARIPLPAAGFNQRRIIPNLPEKHLKAMVPEQLKPEKISCKAAFFTGCMLNYVYPQIGRDLIDILLFHGVEVVIPKAQHCCGTPLFTAGETEIARKLIAHNLEVFSALEVDYIITGCGSCGLAWKKEFMQLLGEDDGCYQTARQLAEKTRDISEFLLEIGFNMDKLQPLHKRITYHDSCHLNRGQRIHDEPRSLLLALPDSTFVEMEHADSCCGSGGSFNLKYYDLSRRINQEKTQQITETGAEIVVVGCPACKMHLQDGLAQDGVNAEAWHIAEVLAESYGLHENRDKE